MDCRRFQEILDEAALNELSSQERAAFTLHLSGCNICRRHWDAHQKVQAVFDETFKPDESSLSKIHSGVVSRLPFSTINQGKSLEKNLSRLFWKISTTFAVAILGVILFFNFYNPIPQSFPTQNSENKIPFSSSNVFFATFLGEGTIIGKNDRSKVISSEAVKLLPNDRIIMEKPGSSRIVLPNLGTITLVGFGEFKVGDEDLSVSRGTCKLIFSAFPRGYKVRLPNAILGIRGTIINVEILDGTDTVMVLEGKIEWQHKISKKTGFFKAGQGAKFARKDVILFPSPVLETVTVSSPSNASSQPSHLGLPSISQDISSPSAGNLVQDNYPSTQTRSIDEGF
ncbi:zf-HC2 domain-containing protein [bacterium]|nr:zf-HC2 domain-containing protein [bacterium]